MSHDLPLFAIRVVPGEVDHVIVVAGELDLATGPQLETRLDRVIESTDGDVAVDLADVGYIDSTGLRVLLAAHDRLAQNHRKLAVRNPSVQVVRLLEICGLCNLITSDRLDRDTTLT
jgi:anti-sigma B factor antagonist